MLEQLPRGDLTVVIQGATGRIGRRHTEMMKAYGTRVVAGVGRSQTSGEIAGVPIFATCADAVARTGAQAAITLVSPLEVLAAVREAVAAGVKLIVSPTEGVPVHDALKACALTREAGVSWVGPSTPGLVVPGRMKLGFIPDATLAPGPIGVMSKSGTLSYESAFQLKSQGIGQSLWVGVGGDPVKGVRFADMLPTFAKDPATKAVLVVGEIGGTEEEELAEAVVAAGFAKPLFVLLAGSSAPEGITMGHAGAITLRGRGTVASKKRVLEAAGASVFLSMRELVEGIRHAMAGQDD